MTNRLIKITLASSVLFLIMPIAVFAEEPSLEPLMPGRTEGTGTYFEVIDSEYLNVSLQSTEEITISLESIPKTISFVIEASTSTNSTNLTIGGLEPNTPYYKYTDSYRNEEIITADTEGKYAFSQELATPYHIWFQEDSGTIFLPEECDNYGTWDEETKTCTLSQDLTQSVEITADDITLDCNNHSIIGAEAGYGIYLYTRSGIIIKNCTVTNFSYGIFLYGSSVNNITKNDVLNNGDGIVLTSVWYLVSTDNVISENNISGNWLSGISLYSSPNNTIAKNTISNNGEWGGILIELSSNNDIIENIVSNNERAGIYIYGTYVSTIYGWERRPSAGNRLIGNYISENQYGIILSILSPNGYFRDNSLVNNQYGLSIDGYFFNSFCWCSYYLGEHYLQDIDTSNTINGRPILYLVDKHNQIIGGESNAGFVVLVNSSDIMVRDIAIESNFEGVLLFNTTNSTIENTQLSNNARGIGLHLSSGNLLTGNMITENQDGIFLRESAENQIIQNTVSNNQGRGIFLTHSSNNQIIENTVSANSQHGIFLAGEWRWRISGNKVFHNNFLNNLLPQARVYYGLDNLFDDGYPSGGNYWSNYDTPVEGCNDNNNDGICDSPYAFSGGQDRYPFMDESGWEMPALPDFAISGIKPVQVVWDSRIDDNDTIDLVSGKPTMVRVYIRMENYESLDKQQLVDVRLNFGGIDYIESKTIEQLEQNNWIDFYPASLAIIGDQVIIAEVDLDNTIEESNETNNGNLAEITIKDTNGLRLVYFPVDQPVTYSGYGPIDLGEYATTVSQSGKFIGATYPVAEGEFINQREDIVYYGSRIKFVGMVKDAIKISKLGELLTGTLADRSVGIVPDDYFEYHDIIPGVDIGDWRGKSYPAITGVLVREGFWATAAHEIGHTYGLGHVEEEYNINGFWVAEESPIENKACFMSAAPDWHTLDFTWIKNDNYANLFKKFRVDKTDPEVLLVSGLIFKDGRIELENWYRFEEGVVDEVTPGDYSIQILDINDQVLNTISFDAPFETYITPEGLVEADVTGFAFVIPYPEGTSKIQIRYEEETLMEINPNSKLLYDAVDLIPDYGFINNPQQRRNALRNKIEALEKMIEQGNFRGAVNKLENDIKDKLEKWLVDDYQKEDILQLSKVEVIEAADGLIYRIGLMFANNKK